MKVPLTLTFDTSDDDTNAKVKGTLALTCRRNLKSLLEDIVEGVFLGRVDGFSPTDPS